MYCTLQLLAAESAGDDAAPLEHIAHMRPASAADEWLLAVVDRVLRGLATGDEQSAVTFDRALATGGAQSSAPPKATRGFQICCSLSAFKRQT